MFLKEQGLNTWLRFRVLIASSGLLLVASCACSNGCRSLQDNATSLGYIIESAVKQLETERENAELVVGYVPVSSKNKPYIILLIPEGPVIEGDLVRKKVPWSVAHKILKDLSYVGIRDGGFIVVQQEGETSFTRYGMHLAKLKELLAYENRGETRIVLRKEKVGVWIVGFR